MFIDRGTTTIRRGRLLAPPAGTAAVARVSPGGPGVTRLVAESTLVTGGRVGVDVSSLFAGESGEALLRHVESSLLTETAASAGASAPLTCQRADVPPGSDCVGSDITTNPPSTLSPMRPARTGGCGPRRRRSTAARRSSTPASPRQTAPVRRDGRRRLRLRVCLRQRRLRASRPVEYASVGSRDSRTGRSRGRAAGGAGRVGAGRPGRSRRARIQLGLLRRRHGKRSVGVTCFRVGRPPGDREGHGLTGLQRHGEPCPGSRERR
jgi:hypothetical protein